MTGLGDYLDVQDLAPATPRPSSGAPGQPRSGSPFELTLRIIAALALAGCSHTLAFAQPQALAKHATEFRSGNGYARVEVEDGGTAVVAADYVVDVTIPGNEESHLWGLVRTGVPDQTNQVSVGTLVAGCGPDRPGGDCLAARVRGPIRVGMQRRLDPALFAIGLFGALGAAVGTTCLMTCRDHNPWAYVGTGIGYVAMIVPLSTVF
jgi:hypothetical protein